MKVTKLVFFMVCVVIASADTKFGLSKHNSSSIESRQIVCKNAAEGQFPYQASLRRSYGIGHMASGVIITNRHILTWSTFGENTTPVYNHAIIGSTRLNKGGIRMELEAIYRHDDYTYKVRHMHNIAVVMTRKEIIFNAYVQPIALPTKPLPAQGNVAVVLSGWGLNRNIGNVRTNSLHFTLHKFN